MGPLIFFSYGMTKCGTTLAFQLARAALEAAGCPQPYLEGLSTGRQINAIEHLSDEMAARLVSFVSELGYPLILKTHTAPNDAVRQLVAAGHAIGHAIYRDPRDMALSMLDHGDKARAEGHQAFAEITSVDAAMTGITNQTDSLSAWLQIAGIRPLGFDAVAFDTVATTRSLMTHLGVAGDADELVADVMANKFIQFNKGRAGRHADEMSAHDSARMRSYFAPLFDLLIDANPVADGLQPTLPPHTLLYLDTPAPAIDRS